MREKKRKILSVTISGGMSTTVVEKVIFLKRTVNAAVYKDVPYHFLILYIGDK